MGLDVYLCKPTGGLNKYGDPDFDTIEQPSTKYPDHYFKIGYFRSNYNESGINNVLGMLGVPDLYDIFAVAGEEYEVKPDWTACLGRCKQAITAYQNAKKEYAVTSVSGPFRPDCNSDGDALKSFYEQASRADGMGNTYNYNKGYFYLDGLDVRAVIPGKTPWGSDTVYVVYKAPNNGGEYYAQALEIVQETIEWVMAQPDPDTYVLHWSG